MTKGLKFTYNVRLQFYFTRKPKTFHGLCRNLIFSVQEEKPANPRVGVRFFAGTTIPNPYPYPCIPLSKNTRCYPHPCHALDFTFATTRKLTPKWSAPRRVVSRTKNSYRIETLEGLPINGRFSSRRLRRFIPRGETSLAKIQETLEQEWRYKEEADDRVEPGDIVEPSNIMDVDEEV
jgi:hypothetical protein